MSSRSHAAMDGWPDLKEALGNPRYLALRDGAQVILAHASDRVPGHPGEALADQDYQGASRCHIGYQVANGAAEAL